MKSRQALQKHSKQAIEISHPGEKKEGADTVTGKDRVSTPALITIREGLWLASYMIMMYLCPKDLTPPIRVSGLLIPTLYTYQILTLSFTSKIWREKKVNVPKDRRES